MNKEFKTEVGLEELVSAMNTTLPKDVIISIGDEIKRLKSVAEIDNYPFTNRALISMYRVLLNNGIGPEEGKRQFNTIQKKWVNNTIKGHEREIFSKFLLQTLVNYHKILDELDVLVEKDGGGVRVEMKNSCIYLPFCDNTEHRKCARGTAIKHMVNYFHPEPYQFLLEKPIGKHSCIIRVMPNISAGDLWRDYQVQGKVVTLL